MQTPPFETPTASDYVAADQSRANQAAVSLPANPTSSPDRDWYWRAEAIVRASGVPFSYRDACQRAIRAIPCKVGPFARETVAATIVGRASTKKIASAGDLAFLRQTLTSVHQIALLVRYLADQGMSVAELRELVELHELVGLVGSVLRDGRALTDRDTKLVSKLLPGLLSFQLERIEETRRVVQLRADRAASTLSRTEREAFHAGS